MKIDMFENRIFYRIVLVLVIVAVVIFSLKDRKNSMEKATQEINNMPHLVYDKVYDEIDSIIVKTNLVNVSFTNGDKFKIAIYGRPNAVFNVNNVDDVINIEFDGTSCTGACVGKERIEITVPSEIAIDVNTKSGNVEMNGISILRESNIYTINGNVDLNSLNNIFVVAKSTNGKINISNNDKNGIILNVTSENGNIVSI